MTITDDDLVVQALEEIERLEQALVEITAIATDLEADRDRLTAKVAHLELAVSDPELSDWTRGVECSMHEQSWCGTCKPRSDGFPPRVWSGPNKRGSFHRSADCTALRNGLRLHALHQLGQVADEPVETTSNLAIIRGMFPCQRCFAEHRGSV